MMPYFKSLAVAALLGPVSGFTSRETVETTTVSAFEPQCPSVVIDVRKTEDFDAGHAACAVNIPGPSLDTPEGMAKVENHATVDAIIGVNCKTGALAANAVAKLKAAGYKNAFNLGGYATDKAAIDQACACSEDDVATTTTPLAPLVDPNCGCEECNVRTGFWGEANNCDAGCADCTAACCNDACKECDPCKEGRC